MLDARAPHQPPLITPRARALLVFLLVTLVASVLIPGQQTHRIGQLLQEDERVNEPARLSARRAIEVTVLESSLGRRYAAHGDSASLRLLRESAVPREQELAALHGIAGGMNGEVTRAVGELDPLVDHWRRLNSLAGTPAAAAADFRDSSDVRESVSDSLVVALSRVQIALTSWSAQRRADVWSHERQGLVANIALVLAALGAIALVFEGGRRERRRARQESQLLTAAELLATAQTVDEAAQRIAVTARELLSARGVSVELLEHRAGGILVVHATDGVDVPRTAVEIPLSGTIPEHAIGDGRTVVGNPRSRIRRDSGAGEGRIMAIPLAKSGSPFGVVVALESQSRPFRPRDLDVADIFGEIGSLTYERVRLLQEARDARGRLERVVEGRSRLMRGFSHDVKNPLGAADGNAALLADGIYGEISDEQRSSLNRIRQAIKRALSLIEDLHELARAETGNLAIQLTRTDVAELVGALGEEYRAAAETKRLRFLVETAPVLLVDTDGSRVRQIVGNLLSNAIKYTSAGTVTLSVRMIDEDGPDGGSSIAVDVADTGPGIPGEQRERLFREFSRGPNQKESGAGLGLAISKLLADALGCRIQVTSEVGRGSTFSLHIPVTIRDHPA